MKKIVLSLLILLCFTLLGTSAIILTGCGETQSENGGTSDPENPENPDDPENPDEAQQEAYATDQIYAILTRVYYDNTSIVCSGKPTNGTDYSSSTGGKNGTDSGANLADKVGNFEYGNLNENMIGESVTQGTVRAYFGTNIVSTNTHREGLNYVRVYLYNLVSKLKRNITLTAYSREVDGVLYEPVSYYTKSSGDLYISATYRAVWGYGSNASDRSTSMKITQNYSTAQNGTTSQFFGDIYVNYYQNYTVKYYKEKPSSSSDETYYSGKYSWHVQSGLTFGSGITKTGYTFAGWKDYNNNYTSTIPGGTSVSWSEYWNTYKHPTKLYATWTINSYTLTAKPNGGTFSSSNPSGWSSSGSNKIKTLTYNSTYGTLPSSSYISKTGYTLLGWSTSSSTSSTNVDSSTKMGTSSTTIFAVWTANRYKVTLNTNGGSGGTSSFFALYDSSNKYSTSTTTSTMSLSTPTRAGYTFGGWTATQNGTNTVINSSGSYVGYSGYTTTSSPYYWKKAGTATLYAKWTANRYQVTLNTNGGSGGTTSFYALYDSSDKYSNSTTTSTMDRLSTPTRTGYSFGGWTATQNGANVVINSSGNYVGYSGYTTTSSPYYWKKAGATTLYAKWTPATRTITVKIYTSTTGANSYSENKDGGIVKISYTRDSNGSPDERASATSTGSSLSVTALQNFAATIDCTESSGYKFMNCITTESKTYTYDKTSAPKTSVSVDSGTSNVTYYAYFKKQVNPIYKEGSNYYINYGMFPQAESLSSITGGATTGSKMTIKGVGYDIYKDSSNNYYLKYNNAYFKFKPIKWRISGTGLGNYGSYVTNVTLISDQVLYADAILMDVNSIDITTNNWSFINSDIYKNIQSLAGIGAFGITNTNKSIANDYFPNPADANYANKVGTATVSSSNLRVASKDEIKSVYGSATSPATATAFAAEILKLTNDKKNSYVDYWTRNLWAYNANGCIVTDAGMESKLALDQVSGVRLAFTIENATFWG